MITPLLDEDNLDMKGLDSLIDHLISGGVHGLFLLGTTGEGPSLKHSLRNELIKEVCELVNKRVPVLVGLMDTSYKESVYLASRAKKMGAEAVVVAPPCFFRISQAELCDFVDQMLGEIALPVYLYNNPGLTKVSFELETAKKLLSKDKIQGIKDSSGDMLYHQKLQASTMSSDTSLFMGPEELLLESLILGGNGGIPGGANIFPKLYVDLYKTFISGDWKKARDMQRRVLQFSNIVYSGNGYGAGKVVNGIKSTLKHLGICNDYVAKPLSKANKKKIKEIENWMTDNQTLVQ